MWAENMRFTFFALSGLSCGCEGGSASDALSAPAKSKSSLPRSGSTPSVKEDDNGDNGSSTPESNSFSAGAVVDVFGFVFVLCDFFFDLPG